MYFAKTVVAVPGPPSVSVKMRSKVLKLFIVSIITTKNVEEVSIGTVIRRNICQELAPSMRAASYKDGEMPCKPAR